MITVRRSRDRGHANHGWLDAYHTFSFADYHDPNHMGFGVLRVINQDRVAPSRGFGTHGHRDMEIVTYVLEGTLEHKDSMGNGSQMRPGDVQLMSAGRGVTHSEFNPDPDHPLHLLQMWIHPTATNTPPRYEQRNFSNKERSGQLRLVVSPDGADGSLTIGQDAKLFAALLSKGDQLQHKIANQHQAWLHLASGEVQLGDLTLQAGDGAAIQDASTITLEGVTAAELILWELPNNHRPH